MGRFLLGGLCAFLLWWGYQTVYGESGGEVRARATDPDALLVTGDAAADGATGEAADAPRRAVHGTGSGGESAADAPDAPSAGDPPDAGPGSGVSFRSLLALDGPERDRAAVELLERAQAAASLDELLDVLGPDNSFLHSEAGRQTAELARRRITDLPATRAPAAVTRLFALCASGPLEADDVAAQNLVDEVRVTVDHVARRTAFDPARLDAAKAHVVGQGETLSGIAARYKRELGIPLEHGTLQVVNRIHNPQALRAGQRLKIPMRPFRTVVHKRSFLVGVHLGEQVVRTYWCAHGRAGADTPEAEFVVGQKIERPDWHPGGKVVPYGSPENPLGTHFVKFRHPSYSGFGIHGTWSPETIRTRASAGCVRLLNEDIADFVDLVPAGSQVEIRA